MNRVKSAAAVLTLTAVTGFAGVAAPALASSTHWSKSQCTSYAKKYHSASKSHKTAANKTLKGHKCTVVVK